MDTYHNTQITSLDIEVIPAKIKSSIHEKNFNGSKKRIGVYVRVSTDSATQATSYDIQVSYFKKYVEKNPCWKLVDIFADEGLSGTSTKNRTEFNRMIEKCKNNEIDYIITKSISRFARNTLDCLQYIRMIKNLGIGIYFQKENIDTMDSKSELFLTILSSIAQEESRSVSENIKWGIQKRFQQGKPHIPTTYFLGYDTNEIGKIIIDEDQASIVKRIFSEFLSGKGTTVIAKDLMKDGILTARGKSIWTSDSVRKILINEKYMGHCLAQKTVTLDFLTHKRVKNKGHQAQYYIKNTHPAIISEKDWNFVQEELKRRSDLFRDPEGKYRMCYSNKSPFSNKFLCGECGRPVTRRRLSYYSGKDKIKNIFSAWHCRAASGRDSEFKNCNNSYVREEEIEKAFMKLLINLKNNKEILIAEAEQIMESYLLTEAENARIMELEHQIENINIKIKEISVKNSSYYNSIYEVTLKHLIYEQEILQIEYEALNENNKDSIYVKQNLDELLEVITNIEDSDIEFNADIFKRIVEKGIIYKGYQVEIKFKCGIVRTIHTPRKRQSNKK